MSGWEFDRIVVRLAGWVPFAAAAMAVVTVWSGLNGDIRAGLFPFGVAATVLLLAVIPQATLRVHVQRPGSMMVAAWWATLAVAGPAGFFLPVGVGTALAIDADGVSGWLAIPPMASMAFGILTLPMAMALLAWAVRRAGELGVGSVVALVLAGVSPVGVIVVGGLAEGAAETVGMSVGIAMHVVSLGAVGIAVARSARSSAAADDCVQPEAAR